MWNGRPFLVIFCCRPNQTDLEFDDQTPLGAECVHRSGESGVNLNTS